MEEFYILLLTFVASLLGTMTGFGSSTVMIPVLLLFFPVPTALLFSGFVHVLVDIWEMEFFKEGLHWRLILFFGIPGMIASFIGAFFSADVPALLMSRIIGFVLLGYVGFVFFKSRWKLKAHDGTAVAGGLISGFFAGAFGLGGAIRSTFLSFFDLPKRVYLFTAGAVALLIDAIRVIGYWLGGSRFDDFSILLLLTVIPVSFLASFVGEEVVDHVPQQYL